MLNSDYKKLVTFFDLAICLSSGLLLFYDSAISEIPAVVFLSLGLSCFRIELNKEMREMLCSWFTLMSTKIQRNMTESSSYFDINICST